MHEENREGRIWKSVELEPVRIPDYMRDILEGEDGGRILGFIPAKKIKEAEKIIKICGLKYEAIELDILGKKYGVLMKDYITKSLLGPSADDASDLKDAGKELDNLSKQSYAERKLRPQMSPMERKIFETYAQSLMMNLKEQHSGEWKDETMKALGLKDDIITKMYVRAAASWLGDSDGLEGIGNISGDISKNCIDWVGYTGKTEVIELSDVQCHEGGGSHFVLKPKLNTRQIDVQINVPFISEDYFRLENRIVENIKTDNEIINQNSRNLVRLFLNLSALYAREKPLPLEY